MIRPNAQTLGIAAQWQLEGLEPLAQTATASLWRVAEPDSVLKVFTPVGRKDEATGTVWLNWAAGLGAVKLLRHSSEAQLMARCEGGDLAGHSETEATKILCEVVLEFSDAAPPLGLVPLNDRFDALISAGIDAHRHVANAQTLARRLLDSAPKPSALHGDVHHHNVMSSGSRWVAIDPKGLVGDACYDVSNIVLNSVSRTPAKMRKSWVCDLIPRMADQLNYCPHRLAGYSYCHAALSAMWSIKDTQDPQQALDVADILFPLAQEANDALFP